MPAPTPSSPAVTDVEPEPFGLLGVRQFFWPAVWTVFLCGSALCAVMWYRSQTRSDGVSYRDQAGGIVVVRSALGRMYISYAATTAPRGPFRPGWSLQASRLRDGSRDAWAPSIWKTIGVDAAATVEAVEGNDGWWVRVRWYVPMIIMAVPAIVWSVLRRRRGMSFFEPSRRL